MSVSFTLLIRRGDDTNRRKTILEQYNNLTLEYPGVKGKLDINDTLKIDLAPLEESKVKLELGDILVFEEKFNEALIYYSQIQYKVKNSVLSQQARFKVAKTSYYKGDFEWAESQLKVLKASTSQLIANDALDLQLLITDHKFGDSLQTPLRLYAKADFLAFQNKKKEAISVLDKLISEQNTHAIVDEALLLQAELFESKTQHQILRIKSTISDLDS